MGLNTHQNNVDFFLLWSIEYVCLMVCRVLMDTPEKWVNVALLEPMERRYSKQSGLAEQTIKLFHLVIPHFDFLPRETLDALEDLVPLAHQEMLDQR